MTAIKQVTIKGSKHMRSLGRYFSFDKEKALGHGSMNISDEDGWAAEMSATRAAYGHDMASRGTEPILGYHQILGFLPDECDINGGKLTPESCLAYAREYLERRYPAHEAVYVLHKEGCRRDGTERYAVHMFVNVTDLRTGRRFDEGNWRQARDARVAAVRELDREHGLRQLERGRNSRMHARQPSRAEGQYGNQSDLEHLRRRIAKRAHEVSRMPGSFNRMRRLAELLEKDGIAMTWNARHDDLQFAYRDESVPGGVRKVNGRTLGDVGIPGGKRLLLSRGGIEDAAGVARTLGRAGKLLDRVLDDGTGMRK